MVFIESMKKQSIKYVMVEKISFTVVSKKKNDLGIKPNEKCLRPI